MLLLGKLLKVVRRKFQGQNTMRKKPCELINYLKPKLQEFLIHNFTSKWQEKEFKAYVPNLPPKTIVSCIDFQHNYAFRVQNKIQDVHWFSFLITILVHIMYCHKPTHNPIDPKSIILKEVHYYILNEKKHDTLYDQHVFMLNWEFLREKGCFLQQHVVWSDGCSG